MKLKQILIIAFLSPINCLYAQPDYRQGYVISNSNDTLYGKIAYRKDKRMSQICKFKTQERKIVKYTPNDIAAYRFLDSKYFVSREVSDKKVFLEYLVKGLVNIYYFRDGRNTNLYYIEKEDMPLTALLYKEGYDIIDGKQSFYTTNTHKKTLYSYMYDAPEVQKPINLMTKPEHRDLIKLAEDYHRAVCTDDSPCIVFAKKQPLVKLDVDVVGGMTYYTYTTEEYNGPFDYTTKHHSSSTFTGGVLLNFWMPRANERWYLRTGMLFAKYDARLFDFYEDDLRLTYKFPFMLEYAYPKWVISPKVALGTTLYYMTGDSGPSRLSPTCMGGFNIRLSDFMRLSFEYNLELFSHSFLGGLQFSF